MIMLNKKIKKNVTYIISDIDKAIAFEWIVERINHDKINLSFILINSQSSYLFNYLQQKNISVYNINCKSKKSIPLSILKCCKLLKKLKPDVIHCHLFLANIIGLTSSKIMNVKSRIYTRHHATYHHTYHPNAVKWDKYCNCIATQIISISDNVTRVLVDLENVPLKKITKISHGFDVNSFMENNIETISVLKSKYNIDSQHPVIGVISRFIELKGIQFVIPAYQKLLLQYPNALLLLFNASGNYKTTIDKMLKELPDNSYKKVVFENNVSSLYRLFDVFIHVPIDPSIEAFGQTYIECMLSDTPLIATKSGIGNEIMVDNFNCLEVPYKNIDDIYEAMIKLLDNKELVNKIVTNAKQTVVDKFSIEQMISLLENLYLQ